MRAWEHIDIILFMMIDNNEKKENVWFVKRSPVDLIQGPSKSIKPIFLKNTLLAVNTRYFT